ncbi:hypothetical protein AB0D66_23895 [Streptomyces sp. NPDC048270]|uniref:hypothetical protein n=1 Tax=Streptomyces sp. NPDC048270 TaxID=3154615 RepID=UPI0033EA3BAF
MQLNDLHWVSNTHGSHRSRMQNTILFGEPESIGEPADGRLRTIFPWHPVEFLRTRRG